MDSHPDIPKRPDRPFHISYGRNAESVGPLGAHYEDVLEAVVMWEVMRRNRDSESKQDLMKPSRLFGLWVILL